MKAVILAGGLGSRLSEETQIKPKPMIEIGGKPIIWHIMKMYANYGVKEFIICLGYKGYLIKEYFTNYSRHMSDITIDIKNNKIEAHNNFAEPWKITLIDTGEETMTGGRLKRIKEFVKDEEAFYFTYGDGVSDVDIKSLLNFHKQHGKLATLTAIQPPGRFGVIDFADEQTVSTFREKSEDGAYINGGFFVLSPKVIDYIENDKTIWERRPLERLASEGELNAYKHKGYWQCMDTLRDKNALEALWDEGNAPWKKWK